MHRVAHHLPVGVAQRSVNVGDATRVGHYHARDVENFSGCMSWGMRKMICGDDDWTPSVLHPRQR